MNKAYILFDENEDGRTADMSLENRMNIKKSDRRLLYER